VSHRNAFLAYSGRLQLVRCIVVDCWSLRRAAERFSVSVPTAARWSAATGNWGKRAWRTAGAGP
jgi:transposase